jgi:hypothetical protein
MGIPVDVVMAEFDKRQKKANEVLKANYKRRVTRDAVPSGVDGGKSRPPGLPLHH